MMKMLSVINIYFIHCMCKEFSFETLFNIQENKFTFWWTQEIMKKKHEHLFKNRCVQ